ncbi:hypothetical protein EHQ92_06375 [Leptospira biflexa]|uniref:hypothetical protein n=1 Tax=Leptospira biflexa TaxID=172 RepID=UPI001082CA64|nr:hypothetical protein [Leptospira biflexa]TGM38001.1 hypothetical protein EHQ80_10560 [Leptospira biflexa]TGM41332.1 hypothetical protein EHQ89_05125 [Leptospira biflexa]TGM47535.1 hypothetical protein EHQ92_06375 [Leptospira biflexa]TGM49999.1 hypothetical protein EHQ88_06710 [Leptospira biflexa]TGM55266.1 hypothetical protein EHQ91_10025 [Leptospira biflexa]
MISLASILSALFLILGSILLGYGILTDGDPMYTKSLGMNLNVIWGSVVFCVGGLFGLGNWLSNQIPKKEKR